MTLQTVISRRDCANFQGSSFHSEPFAFWFCSVTPRVLPNDGLTNCVVGIPPVLNQASELLFPLVRRGSYGAGQQVQRLTRDARAPESYAAVFDLGEKTNVECSGRHRGEDCVRSGHDPSWYRDIFQRFWTGIFLLIISCIWVGCFSGVLGEVASLSANLRSSMLQKKQVYFWPGVNGYFAYIILQFIVISCNGIMLELAEEDAEGYARFGGVQILQRAFYLNLGILGLGILGVLGRRREETMLPSMSLGKARVIGCCRCRPPKKKSRKTCYDAMVLILLIGGAECVHVTTQMGWWVDSNRLPMDAQVDRSGSLWPYGDQSNEMAIQDLPQGLRSEAGRSQFCVVEITRFSADDNPCQSRSHPLLCAQVGNHTDPDAVHATCPRFVRNCDHSLVFLDSGDTTKFRIYEEEYALSLMQKSAQMGLFALQANQSRHVESDGAKCRIAQTWFAGEEVCGSMPRMIYLQKDGMQELQRPLNMLWQEYCSDGACEFTIVRPDETLADFALSIPHFIVFRSSLIGARPFFVVKRLLVDQRLVVHEEVYSYHACMLSTRNLLLAIRKKGIIHAQESVGTLDRPIRARSWLNGEILILRVQRTKAQDPSATTEGLFVHEDESILMQRPSTPSVEIALQYVHDMMGQTMQSVGVWLHTWDRRDSWAFVFRYCQVSLNRPVRQQILAQWRDHQVRAQAELVPVRTREYGPTFLVLTVCPEEWIGVLARVDLLHQQWVGTIMLRAIRFPFVHELFQSKLPTVPCIWYTECHVVSEGRRYGWEQQIPVSSGMTLTFVERDFPQGIYQPQQQLDVNGTSVGTNEDLYTTSSNTTTNLSEAAGPAASLSASQPRGNGENTATPDQDDGDDSCFLTTHEVQDTASYTSPGRGGYTATSEALMTKGIDTEGGSTCFAEQTKSIVPELIGESEVTMLMQRTAPTPFVPFAVAAERGLPYLRTFRLTRRELTRTWYQDAVDTAFEFFRSPERGIWEKRIIGWCFSRIDQFQGESFTIQLRQRGLWATQLIDPFEDAGMTEVNFITVLPQPTMLHGDGLSRNHHDVVVMAFSDETFASDSLPLVVEHELSGILVTLAIQCPPGCTPNVICELLGYMTQCEPPNIGTVYFRYGDIERIFQGLERIGLPAGAHVRLSSRKDESSCGTSLPWQRPLREHETLITPDDASVSRIQESEHFLNHGDDDLQALMQLPWEREFEAEDNLISEMVARQRPFASFFPSGRIIELLPISQEIANRQDVVHDYLEQLTDLPQEGVFTIHVWGVRFAVATFARVSALQRGRSFTESVLREWNDMDEPHLFWLLLIEPTMMPLTFRRYPVDLVLLTDRQKANQERVYLVDVLFTTLPRRVAVIYRAGETLRHLVHKLGLDTFCQKRGRLYIDTRTNGDS